jgi:hypothetical protein
MSSGAVALRDLSQPDLSPTESRERNGEMVSSDSGWAEIDLLDGGTTIPTGTPVEFQTSDTIYLGLVETGEIRDNRPRLHVRIDHSLARQDVSSIQQLWSQEQPD